MAAIQPGAAKLTVTSSGTIVPPTPKGKGVKWKKLSSAVRDTNRLAQASAAFVQRRDYERSQKKFGTALAPAANSPRWDVQEAYRNLFFVPEGKSQMPDAKQGDALAADSGGDDPFMTAEYEETLTKEWKMRQDNFSSHGLAKYAVMDDKEQAKKEREEMWEKLRRKFRMLSYQMGGQDWAMLFDSYDKDGSGGLDVHEFTATVRNDALIPATVFSDNEVANLFLSIDIDRSGVLDVHEFEAWLRNPVKTNARSPKMSRLGLHEHKGDIDQEDAFIELNAGVPFIAEYIATKNVPMWKHSDPELCEQNGRIGTLQKGEVVAVTQVWGKYRLWVHRLRWNKLPSSGWVSSRARKGRGEVLLERLPVDEWSSRAFHETAVAQRVASLDKMQSIFSKTSRGRNAGSEPPKPNVMPKDWVDRRFNIAEPGKMAARLLNGITQPERCKELLDELENQPRSEWPKILEKWDAWERECREIEAEEDRWRRQREDELEEQQRRQSDHEEQKSSSPHPPSGGAPAGSRRPHSAPARRIRSRAHVDKISRDAEAMGFTGCNSARGLGARIPLAASDRTNSQTKAETRKTRPTNPPPGAIDAALRAQARRAQVDTEGHRDGYSSGRGDGDGDSDGGVISSSGARPSFSGIELALKRHSARRKVPPSEVARVMAEEKLAAAAARQEQQQHDEVGEEEKHEQRQGLDTSQDIQGKAAVAAQVLQLLPAQTQSSSPPYATVVAAPETNTGHASLRPTATFSSGSSTATVAAEGPNAPAALSKAGRSPVLKPTPPAGAPGSEAAAVAKEKAVAPGKNLPLPVARDNVGTAATPVASIGATSARSCAPPPRPRGRGTRGSGRGAANT